MVRVNALALAVAVGVALGLGAWTLLALVPRFGAPRLARRLAPYLGDVSPAARELAAARPSEPATLALGLMSPVVDRARRIVSALLGGDESVRRRLRQAGAATSVERYRSRQLVFAAVGAAVGLAIVLVASRSTPMPAVLQLAAVVVAGAIGLLAPEQLLAGAARRRQARIADELATVLDFLALALAAGEGATDAVRRVARTGTGELARELARVVADANAGVPLAVALTRCADAIDLPAFTRAVDQLVGALERGSPLAEVLRAQAADVRDDAKRRLLESAGRKEVAMLVPLVFLILPVTIAFALAPATLVLELGF